MQQLVWRRWGSSNTPPPDSKAAEISISHYLPNSSCLPAGQPPTDQSTPNPPLDTTWFSPRFGIELRHMPQIAGDQASSRQFVTSNRRSGSAPHIQNPDQSLQYESGSLAPRIDITGSEPRPSNLANLQKTGPIASDMNLELAVAEEETNKIGPIGTIAAPSYHKSPDNGNQITTRHRMSSRSARSSIHGTLYLDGVSLGHWMIDHLTNEATRPTTGMTGFDPRVTAAYPGAPIGG